MNPVLQFVCFVVAAIALGIIAVAFNDIFETSGHPLLEPCGFWLSLICALAACVLIVGAVRTALPLFHASKVLRTLWNAGSWMNLLFLCLGLGFLNFAVLGLTHKRSEASIYVAYLGCVPLAFLAFAWAFKLVFFLS